MIARQKPVDDLQDVTNEQTHEFLSDMHQYAKDKGYSPAQMYLLMGSVSKAIERWFTTNIGGKP